jgi:hypothetical protein
MTKVNTFEEFVAESNTEVNEGKDWKGYAFDAGITLHNLYIMQEIQKDAAAKKELGSIIDMFAEFKKKYVK